MLLRRETIDYAIANNLTPFISMQDHHSLVYREEEREMFPTLNHFGVGIIPWSPLARGLLTRPLKTDAVTTRGNTDLCVSLNALYIPSNSYLILFVLTDTILGILKERAPRRLSIGPFFPTKWHVLGLTRAPIGLRRSPRSAG